MSPFGKRGAERFTSRAERPYYLILQEHPAFRARVDELRNNFVASGGETTHEDRRQLEALCADGEKLGIAADKLRNHITRPDLAQ